MKVNVLRNYIRESILIYEARNWKKLSAIAKEKNKEQKEIKTVGDLIEHLKNVQEKLKKGEIKDFAKDTFFSILFDEVPGSSFLGAAKDSAQFFIKMTNTPDDVSKDTPLKNFDLDDDIAKITKTEIIQMYINDLAKNITTDEELKNTLLDDFNINKDLQEFIADKFNNRTVSIKED